MKRSPMPRSTKPLQRKTALKFRSKKRAKVMVEERIPLVIELLEERPFCELGPKFRAVDPTYTGCTHRSTCVDEIVKRSAGGSIVDRDNLATSCWNCNQFKENEPLLALKAGLTKHSWER